MWGLGSVSVLWQEPSTTWVTSKIDDCVPSAATWKMGRGNSTAAHRSWISCSRSNLMWFAMRNLCCTRSWTQNPQAGSSTGGGRVLVVVVGGVVVEAPGMVVGAMVVEVVVVVLLVVGGGSVVVVVVA